MKELLSYQYQAYRRSNKYIMPLITYLFYLGASYQVRPLSIVASLVLSFGTLYFLMVWIGFSYGEVIDPVEEQLLLLKIRSATIYYRSKVVFISIVGVSFSIIGVMYAFLCNIANGFALFKRALTLEDVIWGFLLHFVAAFLGGMIGLVMHPRVLKDRKATVVLAFAIAVMGYAKGPLQSDLPFTQLFTWCFPPLYELFHSLSGEEYFYLHKTLFPLIYVVIYTLVLALIHIHTMKRKGF